MSIFEELMGKEDPYTVGFSFKPGHTPLSNGNTQVSCLLINSAALSKSFRDIYNCRIVLSKPKCGISSESVTFVNYRFSVNQNHRIIGRFNTFKGD